MKYRVWDKKRKTYDEHWYVLLDKDGELWATGWGHLEELSKEDYIIEYATGIKDINGEEIYEGDIVRGKIGGILPGVETMDPIIFSRGIFSFPKGMGFLHNYTTLEIMGNIHQNPELLKINCFT